MVEQRKDILIVEDDFELCELLAQAVKDLSNTYDVKTASNVDEAMVQVRRFQTLQKTFSLVITDVKMAGLSGLELLEVLNSISPQTKTIVMTAYNSAELAERAQELNVYTYLTKPFVISEFRQIVQNALMPDVKETQRSEKTFKLSDVQQRAVRKQLASLRAMTGANTAFLMHNTGNVLALDTLETGTHVNGLCEAIADAQRHIAQQIKTDLDSETEIKQSYFGTDMYSICTYRVQAALSAAVIFGPAVKEGQIWYYMREAAQGLAEALQAVQEEPPTAEQKPQNELLTMLNQYFPGETQPRRRRRQDAPEAPAPQTAAALSTSQPVRESSRPARKTTRVTPESLESRQTRETPPQETPPQEPSQRTRRPPEASQPMAAEPIAEPVTPEPEIDLSTLDHIDWSAASSIDWDTMIAQTDQSFTGLTLDEAQQQGFLDSAVVQSLPQEATPTLPTQASPVPDIPVDEINWDVQLDTDWDTLVSETDQGFGGISIDRAKQEGFIQDIDDE